MSKVRKVLCIVLALMMLIVPMSIGANAAPADGKEVALKLSADSTTVAPGDTLVLKLTWDVDDWSRLWGLPCYILMYDGSVFVPASDFKTNKTSLRMPMGDFGEYVVPTNGASNTLTTANYNAIAKQMTEEEKAIFTTGAMMTFGVNNDGGYTTGGGIVYTDADTVQCEFYLQVAEDATPGTYKVGLPAAAFAANKAYINCCDTGAAKRLAATAIDTTDAILDITVASAAAGPALNRKAADYKMTLTSATTVADPFQFRVTSVISSEDWDTYFANTGVEDATANYITALGFVAFKGKDGFDMETAKAVANGTAAEGYTVATTDYVRHVDGEEATFGARIDITSAETRSDATYVAFVKYVDASGVEQVVFYADSYVASLNTNYTTLVNNYINAYGSTFAG